MAIFSRSGLFGFLLLLAALAPAGAGAMAVSELGSTSSTLRPPHGEEAAPGSVEARLRRISAALREQAGSEEHGSGPDGRLAFVFANGGGRGVGWGNGGFRNGGFGNGGFRNGGFLNGGGFRNGGFRNFW